MQTPQRCTQIILKSLVYPSIYLCIGLSCHGYTYSGPIASSLGGAGIAGRDIQDTSLLNPAIVASAVKNHASLMLKSETLDSKTEENDLSVAIVDSSGEAVSKGSLVYNRREYRGDVGDFRESQWILNMAKYTSPGVSYGFGFSKQTTNDFDTEKEYVDYNMNFGSLINWSKSFSTGYTVYNIFTGKDSRQSRTYGMGLRYGFSYLAFLADIKYQEENVSNNRRLSAMGGFELLIHEAWIWRLGYGSYGPEENSAYSMGFEWVGPRLGFVYAFRSGIQKSAQKLHSIDLRVFF